MTMIVNRRIGIRFLLFAFLLLSSSSSSSFSPSDEYLINCGSNVDSTVDNRRFVSDISKSKFFFTTEGSIALREEDEDLSLSSNNTQIYKSARIFAKHLKYEFNLHEKGTHMVSLHFNRFNYSKIDLGKAQFDVTVNNHVVLTNFTGDDDSVREYLIWVDVGGEIVIRFISSNDSRFAFVNAIEVISAPKDLIADVATSVLSSDNNKTEKLHGLVKQAMEVCYRINVGGFKVTPFNDTLWRTWITDDEFFKKTGVSSEKVYFTGRIKYRNGGASREVGPDNVYNTARIAK